MSDWQVGDLVVCVNAGPIAYPPSVADGLLAEGKIYRVIGYEVRGPKSKWPGMPCLLLAEFHGRPGGFAADRFRKIRPDDAEPCEVEFVELLKLSKHKVSA